MKNFSILFAIIYVLASINVAIGQNISRKLTIVSGGNLPFTFNTLTQYQGGITYSNWTRLNIYYNDTTDIGTPGTSIGWEVTVKAQSNSFISESGYSGLPLGTLQLVVVNNMTPASLITSYSIDLTNAEQRIVTGITNINVTGYILISYVFGKPPNINTLLGKLPDFYSNNLEFKIAPRYF